MLCAATNGRKGLNKMIDILTHEILICLGLLGVNNLNDLMKIILKKILQYLNPH